MAATNVDKASKASNGGIPVSTTVTATRASGVTSLSVGGQTYWPTDTGIKFQTYKLDTNNKFITGSLTDWLGVSNGTNTLNSIVAVGGAGDVGNAIGDIVVMSPTARWGEDLVEAFLQEHTNPLGKHGNITTTAITNNGNYNQSSGTFTIPSAVLPYAALVPTAFSGQVQTFTNSASAGGTFYYINLAGVKYLWGITAAQTTAGNFGGTTTYGVTFPAGFFTSVQSCNWSTVNPQGTAAQFIVGTAPTTTGVAGFWMQSGAVSGATVQGSLFVVGS